MLGQALAKVERGKRGPTKDKSQPGNYFRDYLAWAEVLAEAGYKQNRKNASRLTTNDDIKARVAEILSKASERAEITSADVISER